MGKRKNFNWRQLIQPVVGLALMGGAVLAFTKIKNWPIDYLIGFSAAGLGVFLFSKGLKHMRDAKAQVAGDSIPGLDLGKALSAEQQDLARTLYGKARTDFERVNAAYRDIEDGEMRQQIEVMQEGALRVLNYIAKRPELIVTARRFIDTYQDRAASLTEQFLELEQIGVESGKVGSTKARIKELLSTFDEAYEKEIENLLNAKLMDVDAELEVLEDTMKAEGILDESAEKRIARAGVAADEAEAALKGATSETAPAGPPVNRGGRAKRPLARTAMQKAIYTGGGKLSAAMRDTIVKDKVIAAVLAMTLGSFGAHRFYRGQTGLGLAYAVFFWTFIPGFIGFVEGIRYLAMPVEDYYRAYMRMDAEQ